MKQTLQRKRLKRLRKFGFIRRQRNRGGAKVLIRRRSAGRWRIIP